MAKKATQLDLFPLGTLYGDDLVVRPAAGAVEFGDVPPLVGSDELAGPPMVVHNDHRIVINYNAAGQAARHRALTRMAPERERAGVF